ncbi:twin-arginine translocase subunit TatC [Micrococcus flavus]|uniref:Sec-independent protein translocase protein TatC n=1 Tax=Micrococcus flavus TaxID=384602 RepID=A0A4Y8X377_9MICC|nr:twin-arginine translocase subunit TatC [Micrococcus flavus]MBB4882648.1 sec-independent protein translocase protein TatC [Micrococcus flavus]TFI04118.1 twin-arginine translocase subunit TatC [Micrococcus flavus]GGK39106.1 Sec-independent protein translocase protein TatC [Micrococcus flavus]
MTTVEETARRRRRGSRRAKNPNGEMPLREHLAELRNRIVKSLLAVALGAVGGFFLYQPLMAALTRPVKEAADAGALAAVSFTTIASPFDMMLKVALFIGVVVSSPIWLYQAWAFVAPGLKRTEKKYAVAFLAAAVPLFLLGVALGWLVMPQAVLFFIGFTPDGFANFPDAQTYIDFLLRLFLAFGVAMLLPVVLVGLNMLGVLPAATILKHWRITVFVIALIAALAAPGGDAITMFYLAAPLFLLFGLAILLCWVNDRRRARTAAKHAVDLEAEIAAGPRPLNEI